MKHIQDTIADLEFLIGEFQRTVEILRRITDGGGPGASTLAQRQADDPPPPHVNGAERKIPEAMPGVSLSPVLRAVLPSCKGRWFTATMVKKVIAEEHPELTPTQVAGVNNLLLNRVTSGELETRGTGRDREFRVVGAEADLPAKKKRTSGMGQVRGGVISTLLNEILPTFHDEWFTALTVKEIVAGEHPDLTKQQIDGVNTQLLDRMERGELESEGAGRRRKYRVIGSKAVAKTDAGEETESEYERRKRELLS